MTIIDLKIGIVSAQEVFMSHDICMLFSFKLFSGSMFVMDTCSFVPVLLMSWLV